MTVVEGLLLAAAGLAAGVANSVAGGGSLLSFPALLLAGYPPVDANVTNSVSLWPGYVSSVVPYADDLRGERHRLVPLGVTAAVGGAAGTVLLLVAPPEVFDTVVPYLVLLAVALLAVQPRVAAVVRRRAREGRPPHRSLLLHLVLLLAAVYGGYFGGGLGVIVLAVLGIFLPDDLSHLNGIKNALSVVINSVALIGFALFGPVAWEAVLVVGPAAMVGGVVGSRTARRIPTRALRWAVLVWGTAVGVRLLVG